MEDKERMRIGIVDDHALFREGLKKLILSTIKCEVIFDVSDGNDVIKLAGNGVVPDILLMDLNMVRVHGKETMEWLLHRFPVIKIIVISMSADEELITEMILAGARAYLHKSISADILIDCINAVWEKDWYLSESMTTRLLKDIQQRRLTSQSHAPVLTETEKRILSYLCKELTHTEIAKRMFLSVRTIDDYSNKLTKKLNVRSKAGLIVYAVKNSLDKYIPE